MKNLTRNVRFETVDRNGVFDVYLNFSGQSEYLLTHRKNDFLHDLLKNGPKVDELRRWKASKISARRTFKTKMENTVKHLLAVADEYVFERSYSDTVYKLASAVIEAEEQTAA